MKNLEEFDQRGWIVGPEETEKSYLRRIEALNAFYNHPPSDVDHFLTTRDWHGANVKLKGLYGIAPDWIVAHFSDRALTFFQGAATWISEKKGYRIPLIQLREKLEGGSLLWIYSKEEVLSHEASHAARMQFDEPRYEEIFAYRTSPYVWRRLLGPLFERPWEASLLICLIFVPFIAEVTRLFWWDHPILAWSYVLPLGFFLYVLSRLLILRLILSVALRRLSPFLKDRNKKWAVAFRLKDSEIFQFAFLAKEKLKAKIRREDSLRWSVLKEMHFKKI